MLASERLPWLSFLESDSFSEEATRVTEPCSSMYKQNSYNYHTTNQSSA